MSMCGSLAFESESRQAGVGGAAKGEEEGGRRDVCTLYTCTCIVYA